MRILYDGQIYRLQTTGGITRYFNNVIGRLPRDFEPSLIIEDGIDVNLPTHPNLTIYRTAKRQPFLEGISYRGALSYYRILNWSLSKRLSRRPYDVFHPTYYDQVIGPDVSSYRAPIVLTVWDMIHERFPTETMDVNGLFAETKRRALHAADALICISESTRNDLLELYPALADRVYVSHLAASLDASMSHGPERVPNRPYFLHVGLREGYKNFDLLLAAFARVAPAHRELALCIVGPPLSKGEHVRIHELGIEDRVELIGHPTDEHLAKLYRSSLALVYPSLYEGFGLPPLEAMNCGTAVVASNRSSLPEVIGDAGLLFDPRSADELANHLLAMLDRPAERERLIELGFHRARQFSWDLTVEQTVEIYRAVAASSGVSRNAPRRSHA